LLPLLFHWPAGIHQPASITFKIISAYLLFFCLAFYHTLKRFAKSLSTGYQLDITLLFHIKKRFHNHIKTKILSFRRRPESILAPWMPDKLVPEVFCRGKLRAWRKESHSREETVSQCHSRESAATEAIS